MRAQISVQRFNPEISPAPFSSDYFIDYDRGTTLLSALLQIKAGQDGTLTFRASCRASICGSCLMQVNGTQKLACRVSVREEIERRGKIHLGPMANMTVIKDLVVEMNPFWEKIRAITPYLIARSPETVLPASLKNIREELHHADGCILCGACLSACATYEVSPGFLGPAALAKAYRFQVDPRDRSHQNRLLALQQADGIWDCVRCQLCVSVCPKEVAPMEQIVRLRRLSLAAGFNKTLGARHITQFAAVVRQQGQLNETLLPVRILWGHFRKTFRMFPLAIGLLWRGKMPFPFKRHKGYKVVQRLFQGKGC